VIQPEQLKILSEHLQQNEQQVRTAFDLPKSRASDATSYGSTRSTVDVTNQILKRWGFSILRRSKAKAGEIVGSTDRSFFVQAHIQHRRQRIYAYSRKDEGINYREYVVIVLGDCVVNLCWESHLTLSLAYTSRTRPESQNVKEILLRGNVADDARPEHDRL
jgi:hypothetical protein